MSFVEQVRDDTTSAPVPLKTLYSEADIGQHQMNGTLAMGGIHPNRLEALNRAEEALFNAVIASFVPGIDAGATNARKSLDSAYNEAFGGSGGGKSHSLEVLKRISKTFDDHGLGISQLEIS